MTTGLMGPLEECRNLVTRDDYPVLIPEEGPVLLSLLPFDLDGFQTSLHAFVDVSKRLQVLNLLESI